MNACLQWKLTLGAPDLTLILLSCIPTLVHYSRKRMHVCTESWLTDLTLNQHRSIPTPFQYSRKWMHACTEGWLWEHQTPRSSNWATVPPHFSILENECMLALKVDSGSTRPDAQPDELHSHRKWMHVQAPDVIDGGGNDNNCKR